MSKIVDALRKIQSGSPEQLVDRKGDARRKLGRVEPHNGVDAATDEAVSRSKPRHYSRRVNLDFIAMRDAGLLAPESESKMFEDEYRVIKRPILSNAFGKGSESIENGHIVLVTSALAGDGKTFTCINLALSLAKELDHSVLLLDADLPKPHVSTLFDAQDEPGLLDYLNGTVTHLEDIELGTTVSGLSIIPAGTARDHATELLSGQRMLEFLELVHRRDPKQIILVDSPPLLQTTEARALGAIAGQIVLIIRAGATPKQAVQDAIAAVDSDKPINTVLNQVKFSRGSGYYYGYNRSYGGQAGAGDAAK